MSSTPAGGQLLVAIELAELLEQPDCNRLDRAGPHHDLRGRNRKLQVRGDDGTEGVDSSCNQSRCIHLHARATSERQERPVRSPAGLCAAPALPHIASGPRRVGVKDRQVQE
eukprot:755091-Hanusia_phi.AAC.7